MGRYSEEKYAEIVSSTEESIRETSKLVMYLHALRDKMLRNYVPLRRIMTFPGQVKRIREEEIFFDLPYIYFSERSVLVDKTGFDILKASQYSN